jgi:hypothetical protein
LLAIKLVLMKQSCSRALAALLLGIAITTGGCKDGTEPPVPGSLQIMAGNGQTAAAGTAVTVPPSVKLLTTKGNPLGGATVTFASSTNGVVTPTERTTDAQGIATLTSWTLPTQAGSHQLTVSSAGVSSVVISATATAGAVAKLIRQSTERQSATVASDVADPPVVIVADAHDNPIAGVAVTFGASGSGSVRIVTPVSDASGRARAEAWTLGPRSGEQFVLASLNGTPGVPVVSFTATAVAGPAVQLAVTRQPSTTVAAGSPLAVQPVVEIHDAFNNRVLTATNPVTASLTSSTSQTLSGTTTVTAVAGRATFSNLVVDPAGNAQLQFMAAGITDATSASFNVPATTQCPGLVLRLDNMPVGQSTRYLAHTPDAFACVDFGMATNGGQQYLVQVENISINGNSDAGVFPGTAALQSGFDVTVTTSALPSGNTINARRVANVPAGAVHSWDFGDGAIYEVAPPAPVGGARPAVFKPRASAIDANSMAAAAAVGDTIIAFLDGIPRLGIQPGNQRAVVRYVGPDLIIAEDVRLSTLQRQGGGTNTPLTPADMEAIAADYAQYSKVQAEAFFGGRHNAATEASGSKPIAIHSLMGQDNIWGYTYSNTNYFVWDFWVGTNGVDRGPNQQIERNSNNLFMHELAHMRHFGMIERAGNPPRGNRWLVEGFARATERWPIAMRLLGVTDFSRTGNVVLPGYPTPSLNTLEDVPVYTQASVSMYGGYAASSYVFDYFADQVARTTATPWRTALGEFLVAAGSETTLNQVISRYLPGLDFTTLLTRARIALYLDDFASGLPDWTQFHQYQLRASRQTQNPQLDPRNLWSRIAPGTNFSESREVLPGGAFGYVIDGTAATANARILFNVPRTSYAALSITRIR